MTEQSNLNSISFERLEWWSRTRVNKMVSSHESRNGIEWSTSTDT